jgi:hypothetical protein
MGESFRLDTLELVREEVMESQHWEFVEAL